MTTTSKVVCDLPTCQAAKVDSNHWWILKINQSSLEIFPYRTDIQGETRDYCGEQHLIEALSVALKTFEADCG